MELETIRYQSELDRDSPILLFERNEHRVYWLGLYEDTIFRCNIYLIVDGEEAVLVDPGGIGFYDVVRQRVEQVVPVTQLRSVIISHQDPDIAASLAEWLVHYPELFVISSPRTMILFPYYGVKDLNAHDIEEKPEYLFTSGNQLQFYPAPFLHSPMSFVTFDPCSGFMFTSDIFACIDAEWQLVVRDFNVHIDKMDLFHVEYMASNCAARGFVESIEHLPVKALLPQHGSIISQQHVPSALDYLRNLQCGLDVIYPQLK